ncbi:MAG: YigZ family protein [Oscillospiraceae bacterium]|nr:YigZ family protein [Oscillospiraceae bacterium]
MPRGPGEAEIVEKRSRFIGALAPLDSDEAAKAFLQERRALHKTASHHVYAWLLRDGGARYSDDGEPQGTGGPPVLEVLRREGVRNVCCVVTRYFGGTLLGAAGLTRAYAAAAKAALEAAGIAEMRPWTAATLVCGYALWRRMQLELAACGGVEEGVAFAAEVTADVALPTPRLSEFQARAAELSAGQAIFRPGLESFRAL